MKLTNEQKIKLLTSILDHKTTFIDNDYQYVVSDMLIESKEINEEDLDNSEKFCKISKEQNQLENDFIKEILTIVKENI